MMTVTKKLRREVIEMISCLILTSNKLDKKNIRLNIKYLSDDIKLNIKSNIPYTHKFENKNN